MLKRHIKITGEFTSNPQPTLMEVGCKMVEVIFWTSTKPLGSPSGIAKLGGDFYYNKIIQGRTNDHSMSARKKSVAGGEAISKVIHP